MNSLFRFAWNVFFTFTIFGFLFSQQDANIVKVDHADSLVGLEINGESARELIGHVQFSQGKTIVTCERAIQYLVSKKISMEGVVEVRDSSMRLVGSRGMYYSDSRIAEAFDRVLLEDPPTTLRANYGKYFVSEKKAYFNTNVYVEDTSSVLTANEFTYYREEQKTLATGNVKITSKENGITIYGNRFENLKKQKYSKITEEPKVVQVDTAGGKNDTLTVTAIMLESYQDSLERLTATDSVMITRNGLAAESGISTYYTKFDSIILQRSPFVWYTTEKHEDNQVSGDNIFIKLVKRKLRTVYVRGRAVAISRADTSFPTKFNQMTGQEIVLSFENDKVRQIDVNTTATSLYYLFDKGKGNGLNKTSGDHVTMLFVDGKLDKIKVVAGVEGQYFPERLVKNKEAEYNLQGFNWRDKKPDKIKPKK